jgi:integrase
LASAAHLTQRTLTSLRPAAARYVLWDSSLPGFGIRVSTQGSKTFVLKYRLASGRVRWKTLGRVEQLSLEEARKRARRDTGLVADNKDPLRAIDAARDAVTFDAAADRFLEEHVEARRKSSTLRLYRQVIESYLRPRLGTTPITSITTEDLLRVHHALRRVPYAANRTIAVASALFNWAASAGLRGVGPHANPCDDVPKYRERSRQRYLTPEEFKRVGCALRVAEQCKRLSPSTILAIRLLLLTGARVNEILSLEWRAVNIAAGVLRLNESKTGAKTILLGAPAVDLLKEWPRWAKSEFVFPGEGRGEKKGQHKVNLKDGWGWVADSPVHARVARSAGRAQAKNPENPSAPRLRGQPTRDMPLVRSAFCQHDGPRPLWSVRVVRSSQRSSGRRSQPRAGSR